MRKLTAILCLTLAVLLGSVSANASDHCEDTNHPQYDGGECEGQGSSSSGWMQKLFSPSLQEWKTLAKQGNVDAQFHLGKMYEEGKGVPQNNRIAVKWYRLAAEQGYASAQYNLGNMYR